VEQAGIYIECDPHTNSLTYIAFFEGVPQAIYQGVTYPLSWDTGVAIAPGDVIDVSVVVDVFADYTVSLLLYDETTGGYKEDYGVIVGYAPGYLPLFETAEWITELPYGEVTLADFDQNGIGQYYTKSIPQYPNGACGGPPDYTCNWAAGTIPGIFPISLVSSGNLLTYPGPFLSDNASFNTFWNMYQ